MPFIHTYVHRETNAIDRRAIVEAIHQALVASIGMPADELFNMLHEYSADSFHFSRTFNDVKRSDQIVVVEITLRRGRSDAMKRELYRAIAANVCAKTTISSEDVFIFMHENDFSDWSVGHGQFAMELVQNNGLRTTK